MKKAIKKRFMQVAETIHLRVFNDRMSPSMKDFLMHLSWSFVGGGIASVAMMAINIAGGRLMGPSGYGSYGLVLAVSQIILIPIILSLDISGVRFISTAQTNDEKSKYISSSFYFVLTSSVTVAAIIIIFRTLLANQFHIATTILVTAAIYSAIIAVKTISDSFARALFLFSEQFAARMLEVATISIVFSLYFFILHKNSYDNYVGALLAGAAVFVAIIFGKYFPFLRRFNFLSLKKQLSHSSVILIGAAFGAGYNILEKSIIVKYLGIYELGIYMAYFTSSFNITSQITQMFANVFFPSVARGSGKSTMIKLERLFRIFFIPTYFLISLIIFLIIKLFGKAYGINIPYILGFSLFATLQALLSVYYYIFVSASKGLYGKYIFLTTSINILQLIAYGVIIYLDKVSIGTIIVFSIINSILNVILQRRLILSDSGS